MKTLSHSIEEGFFEGIDLTKRYLESKVIYLCDCGRGKKISNHATVRVVDVRDGMCIHCRHAALSRRVPANWVPGMGLFKVRRMMECSEE